MRKKLPLKAGQRITKEVAGSSLLRRPCLSLACFFTVLILAGCASSVLLHPTTARRAVAASPVDPVRNGDRPQVITVTNSFGHRLAGWVFSSPTNRGVILIGDGNATGIAQTYEYNRYLLHQGFNVVFLSYQSFDSNEGTASLSSLPGDAEAFYNFCKQEFPNEPIALVGESLSAGVFFCFSSCHPEIAGVVLEGVVDLKTVALSTINRPWIFYPVYPIALPAALFVNAAVPRDLSAQRALQRHSVIPALFVHHPNDGVTPYTEARRIFGEYDGPKEFIIPNIDGSRGFHMTGNFDSEIKAKVINFIKQHLNSQ